jgi:hypothetical protein
MTRAVRIKVQEMFDESRHMPCPERAHRHCQVEVGIEAYVRMRAQFVKHVYSAVLGIAQLRGNMDLPVRERLLRGAHPLADSRFTRIDLLATTNEADNNSPIVMAIQAGDQESWLGLVKAWMVFLALHECSRLSKIPGTLRFVKDRNVV